MFAHIRRAISYRLVHCTFTSTLLRHLGDNGQEGMILADYYRRQFRARLSGHTAPNDLSYVMYIRCADPTRRPDCIRQKCADTEEPTTTGQCCIRGYVVERLQDPTTSYAVIRMRLRLQESGFDMITEPTHHRHNPDSGQGLEVTETYSDHAHPHLTVTLKHPLPEGDEQPGPSLIEVTDHGRHVTAWSTPIRNEFVAAMQAHLIRERVDAYLARTN